MARCECCGEEHEGSFASGRFCSKSCSTRFGTLHKREEINKKVKESLLGRKRPGFSGKGWPKGACQRGGEVLKKRRDENILLWLEGEDVIKDPRLAKKALLEIRGTSCEECGWNEVNPFSGVVYTEMDHIDGNRKNNRISNLKILCPNCHSLTPTIHNLNRKKSTSSSAR